MTLEKKSAKNWLILVLLIFLLLKLPCLFEPFTYGDEGIYLALGQAARKGVVWYSQIHDNKPPMLYLMAGLAGNFTIYRLLHFGWSLITVLAFWQLAKLIFPKKEPAVVASTMVFSILSSIHTFEGNIANAENFMMLPTIAAFYLVFEKLTEKKTTKQSFVQKHLPYFGAGFLLSIATLFKVPAAFDFAALFTLILLIFFGGKKKNYHLLFANYLSLTAGFILPILTSFVYYLYKGALGQYFIAAFGQNLPYLSSWNQSTSQTGGLPLALLGRAFLLFLVCLALFIYRKKISLPIKLVLTWFAFSWFATLLSSRPYPHYLLQIIPAFALSFGLFFTRKKEASFEIIVPLALALVFRITFLAFHFWQYPNLNYYQNFYQYALGQKTKQEYFTSFDPQANNLYLVAEYLRNRTLPEEKIFIWGTRPSIYPLANRLPVGRYTTSYHIIDFNGQEQTLTSLEKERPRYFLITGDEERRFVELEAFVRANYALEKQIGEVKIFHLVIQND